MSAAPVYSHLTYDIVPGEDDGHRPARHPDRRRASTCCSRRELPKDGKAMPFVSDFFDFSIYIDADEDDAPPLVCRAASCGCADRLPRSAVLFPPICRALGRGGASTPPTGSGPASTSSNLRENILPTRQRAEPDPAQGAEPPHRAGRPAAALVENGVSGRLAHWSRRRPTCPRSGRLLASSASMRWAHRHAAGGNPVSEVPGKRRSQAHVPPRRKERAAVCRPPSAPCAAGL